ncbi:helix-turn-helix domain-containing protein [Micromonospora sp. NPDC048063]|uniref:AlbA family DNA-binding domain-containing protein n=1 Tax=Micromonospora sp. NPDC048063 TaxID=3364256 RepID=UPI00371467B0
MAIRWSSIHEQLGEQPRDLDFDLVEAAVEQGAFETDSLDWKQTLPGKEEKQLEEFAKDVAAMANTRGGLIVYGVAEERGKGRATTVLGVDASEGAQRRLRALAANRVHPLVAGLDLVPLTSADGALSVLVLSVPRSADAPHLIGQKEQIGAPYRSGPETHWMRERDLERAYADRFARRAADSTRLAEMVDETADLLDLSKSWVVAAALPTAPLSLVSGPPTRQDVQGVMQSALGRTLDMLPSASPDDRWIPIHELGDAVLNPRVGLRRWVMRRTSAQEDPDLSVYVHAELHHDGSLVMAFETEGWGARALPEDQHQVVCTMVEAFAADFVALSEVYARSLGGQAPLMYRAEMRRADPSKPLVAVDLGRYAGGFNNGRYEQVRGSQRVRRFVPVVGETPVAADADVLRIVGRDLASDILSQFGVARLILFRA